MQPCYGLYLLRIQCSELVVSGGRSFLFLSIVSDSTPFSGVCFSHFVLCWCAPPHESHTRIRVPRCACQDSAMATCTLLKTFGKAQFEGGGAVVALTDIFLEKSIAFSHRFLWSVELFLIAMQHLCNYPPLSFLLLSCLVRCPGSV